MNAQLELAGVAIEYAGLRVVGDVDFTLTRGEIGCLLGPSGCGKTSVLRAIAGFEPLAAGVLRIGGREVATPRGGLPPEKRRVGMVFQDFALYPHLNVERNVGFGLRGHSRRDRAARVRELLELVGLEDQAQRYPHQLSGGQQQRVALIRAMAPRPEILLLDEPFSSMDAELRSALALEVRRILKSEGATAILVTHDQLEAFAMADCIGVLGDGRMHQCASPYDLYHRPADRFVASFIGRSAILAGTVLDARRVETALGVFEGVVTRDIEPGSPVDLLVRPDDVIHDDASELKLEVVSKTFRGAEHLYTLRVPDGGDIYCLVPSHHNHAVGERIGVQLDAQHLVPFRR